jgi:DNA-binding transcriptional LysR family regulator
VDLRQLEYFAAVARHQHFTRAAAAIGIAQPSLSQQIMALEAELDVRLFDRAGRQVRLTDAGRSLLPYATRILALTHEARRSLTEHAQLQRGRVTIGTTPTAGARLLPRALATFNVAHPGIDLVLREAGSPALIDLLVSGDLDLAIVILPVRRPVLAVAHLLTEEIVLAVATSHPLATSSLPDGVAPAALADEHFILVHQGYGLRRMTLDMCARADFNPRIVLDGAEMDTVLGLVEAGLGVACLPRLALTGTRHIAVPIADPQLRRTLGLAWRREPELTGAARALRDHLTLEAEPDGPGPRAAEA